MFDVGVMQKDANGNLVQRKIEGDELKKILEENDIFDKDAKN